MATEAGEAKVVDRPVRTRLAVSPAAQQIHVRGTEQVCRRTRLRILAMTQ